MSAYRIVLLSNAEHGEPLGRSGREELAIGCDEEARADCGLIQKEGAGQMNGVEPA